MASMMAMLPETQGENGCCKKFRKKLVNGLSMIMTPLQVEYISKNIYIYTYVICRYLLKSSDFSHSFYHGVLGFHPDPNQGFVSISCFECSATVDGSEILHRVVSQIFEPSTVCFMFFGLKGSHFPR